MEHLVDLDVLAASLRPSVDAWAARAEIGLLTWRDETADWPQPITSDRAEVRIPESLGISLRKRGSDDLLTFVVWTGGWADVEQLTDGEVLASCPKFQETDGAYAALVRTVERFLA